MNPIGVSNKFFYYTSSGKGASFNIAVRVNLCHPLDRTALLKASQEALKEFHGFSVRPVVHNNRFFFADNNLPPVLFEDDGTAHCFGSDETNGHLFFLACGQEHFTLSFWHGMSDTAGANYLLMSILKHYAEFTGGTSSLPDRFSVNPDSLVKDPYTLFSDPKNSTQASDSPSAFVIPEPQFPADSDAIYNYSVKTDLADFAALTKKLKVSFVPLLAYVVSGAIHDSYDTGGLPVTAMVPVDLRRLYGIETADNFSDGIVLPIHDASGKPEDVCPALYEAMHQNISRENFDRVIYGKCFAVGKFEAETMPVAELARNITRSLPPGTKKPVTYALTYPGREDFSAFFPGTVKSRDFLGMARAFFVVAYASGSEFILRIGQRFRKSVIAENIVSRLEKAGLSGRLEDEGLFTGSSLIIEKLENA